MLPDVNIGDNPLSNATRWTLRLSSASRSSKTSSHCLRRLRTAFFAAAKAMPRCAQLQSAKWKHVEKTFKICRKKAQLALDYFMTQCWDDHAVHPWCSRIRCLSRVYLRHTKNEPPATYRHGKGRKDKANMYSAGTTGRYVSVHQDSVGSCSFKMSESPKPWKHKETRK